MSIIERARAKNVPPSLLQEQGNDDGGLFEAAINKVMDANELCLSTGPSVAEDFKALLQMCSSVDTMPGDDPDSKKAALVSRRCIVLALVGSTPSSNPSLSAILKHGYLSTVKQWMDDTLSGAVGSTDLLLHLLSNIKDLPVTKSVVKESGMGKAIGSVEKNKICAGTPNEEPIKERVMSIKDAWNKSVKARKEKPLAEKRSTESSASLKRELDSSSQVTAPIVKKAKVDDTKKSSSLSSLMQKMAPSSNAAKPNGSTKTNGNGNTSKKPASKSKQKKRVKWTDHFGGNLTASKILENGDGAETQEHAEESSVSWSDRRKRDRLREKELLAKAKKAKLTDDDDMGIGADIPVQRRTIQPTIAWHVPALLPERSDAPPPQVNSQEKVAQTARMASVAAASYASEYNVPSNPTPMSDVEQALDMTSQSSAVTQTIPFFVPLSPTPASVAAAPAPQLNAASSALMYPGAPAPPATGAATVEVVQSLGLPMFLVGQNVQALQTLAATPSLLSTFVDSNGMYDQVRLTSLVQTLGGTAPAAAPPAPAATGYTASGFGGSSVGSYGAGTAGGIYGPASEAGNYGGGAKTTGYRGAQNNGEGNLHLSGYGPSTTQAEIIALFSPYVQVDEVVMKQNFCFVNTNDPVGAKNAREALHGALLGGQPVRINMAQRKNRDAVPSSDPFNKGPSTGGSFYGQQSTGFTPGGSTSATGFGQPPAPPPPMGQIPGQSAGAMAGSDLSNVRDDRGNPATKNLFVAGYGHGTTETLLRQVFSPHCEIVGVIQKGTFSFINTAEKAQAVHAREVLSGTMLNGGVLRINFAKESGRLGTSFDLTYGNRAQQQQQAPRSHYGPPQGF